MFSYYGSKSKVIKYYPKPLHPKIIEYFAGSARYGLEYWEHDVILVDKYPVITGIWKYLQSASPKDILGLPKMKAGQSTDEFKQLSKEERWLMGFMVQQGVNSPRKTVSKVFGDGKMPELIEKDKSRIAENLYKIKHWQIVTGDYRCLSNVVATHFIDPPYQHGGQWYHSSVNNSHMNYSELASWAMERKGQVMVCENTKANWMEFKYLADLSGSKHKTKEVLWYKEKQ